MKEILVTTLWYLVIDCSQQTLSFSFRIGRSTVSYIPKEVFEAIYTVLAPIYLRPPSTADECDRLAIDCPKNSSSKDYNYKGIFYYYYYYFIIIIIISATRDYSIAYMASKNKLISKYFYNN